MNTGDPIHLDATPRVRVVCSGYGRHKPRLLGLLVRFYPAATSTVRRWALEASQDGSEPPTSAEIEAAMFDGWGWISEGAVAIRSRRTREIVERRPRATPEVHVETVAGLRRLHVRTCPSCGASAPGLTDERLDAIFARGHLIDVPGVPGREVVYDTREKRA